MWRGEEKNGARVASYLLHSRVSGVAGLPEQLFHQKTTQTMADKHEGVLAKASLAEEIKHL